MLPKFLAVAAACHFLDVKANPSVYEPGKIIPFSRFFSLQQMHCMGLTSPNESLHCKNTTQSITIPLLFAQALLVAPSMGTFLTRAGN
jgi:hypothetical protein